MNTRFSDQGIAAARLAHPTTGMPGFDHYPGTETESCAACRVVEGHRRLAHDGHPEWAVGDWHCACGWWGNLGWSGFGAHLCDIVQAAHPDTLLEGAARDAMEDTR